MGGCRSVAESTPCARDGRDTAAPTSIAATARWTTVNQCLVIKCCAFLVSETSADMPLDCARQCQCICPAAPRALLPARRWSIEHDWWPRIGNGLSYHAEPP